MKHLGSVLGLFFALGSAGCTAGSDGGSEFYEACSDSSDCSESDVYCTRISVDWGDRIATDNICTWGCSVFDDRCPLSNDGNPGVCWEGACHEGCEHDSDCDGGFRCGNGGGFGVCLPY